jgi:CrcB protein
MRTLLGYLVVFFGAGLGGLLRHAVNRVTLLTGGGYPWNTVVVNVVGSFAMGLLAGWWAFRGGSHQTLRLFLATGVLGGFTTFSAFSLDAALLWERGRMAGAMLYITFTVVLALAGLFLGLALMRR